MAFPTIPTAAANTLLTSTTASASTTHTFPNLTTLAPQAGDLIIAVIGQYQGGTAGAEFSSWGAGLTEIADRSNGNATDLAIGVAAKIATGSESGTFTVTSAHSFISNQYLMRIPAATWFGTLATGLEVSAMAIGTGAYADVASFNPTNWDVLDTLWCLAGFVGETTLAGNPPTIAMPSSGFSNELLIARTADAVGAVGGTISFAQTTAASVDPGAFTGSNPTHGNFAGVLIAVRPAIANISATGSGAITLAGSSTATVEHPATASGNIVLSGTATGDVTAPEIFGTADSSIILSGSATGDVTAGGTEVFGTADSSITLSGTATGIVATPPPVAGYSAWFDASVAASITLSDATHVSKWVDLGGGNDAVQATGANQPVWNTRTQNGLPVLDFDGGDYLTSNLSRSGRPVTVFVVIYYDTGVGQGTYPCHIGATSGGSQLGIRFATSKEGIAKAGTAWLADYSVGLSNTTAYVVACVMDASTINWTVNGSSVETDSDSTTFTGGATTIIGAASTVPADAVDGWIAEIIQYSSALSSSDRIAVQNYLGAKWGITLAGAEISGTASGSIILSGSASATVEHPATASGSIVLSASASATVEHPATATTAITLSGSATGDVTAGGEILGTAAGAITLSAAATGTVEHPATAVGAITLSGSATGTVTPQIFGTASGALVLAATATGTVAHSATASGGIILSGSATGVLEHLATASSSILLSSSATGTVSAPIEISGTAASAIILTAIASGLSAGPAGVRSPAVLMHEYRKARIRIYAER